MTGSERPVKIDKASGAASRKHRERAGVLKENRLSKNTMPSIIKRVFIRASQERVFDLISDVESFPNYSKHIKEINLVSPGKYNWRVEFFGKSYTWKANVKSDPPKHYAWQSTTGIYNAGSYTLEALGEGTSVVFKMEYRTPFSLLDKITGPIVEGLMRAISSELIAKVKTELEGEAHKRGLNPRRR